MSESQINYWCQHLQAVSYVYSNTWKHMYTCIYYSTHIQWVGTKKAFVHRRVQWAPYPAQRHLGVIMRQTINFQVHLLRFCPVMGVRKSREASMYRSLEPSRATDTAREIWSERCIHYHVYRHTYSNTWDTQHTRSYKLTLSTDIYFYIFRKCILNISVLWRWQLYVKVKYT